MNLTQDNVVAYFQPILSAESTDIYAYEVLGRYLDNDGKAQSLGSFFSSPDTSHEEALRVDRIVRKYAMKKYAEEKRNEYLFINIRLAWLLPFIENPEDMITLQLAKEFGIAPEKLVIEITEEDFNSKGEYLRAIVHYKKAGCRIALDDYGKEASNIDRLAKLQPDIIKINIDYIHNSETSYHYREYFRAIAVFADSVGIEILYEGIETERQLDICISSKGRFFQGFLFAVPQASMCDTNINTIVFATLIADAYSAIQTNAANVESLRNSFDVHVEGFFLENPFDREKINDDEYLIKLFRELPEVIRIYLCSRKGVQLSNNIERQSGDNIVYVDYKNKNWAWRGYFHEIIKAFIRGRKSCLTNPYRDFSTKEKICTYCYAINDDVFLFVDIIKESGRINDNVAG
jgi:EAL domain-containing protein (putative c-di-GMP-specific phosphodiesterase class I)